MIYTLVDESVVTVLRMTLASVQRQLRELAELAQAPLAPAPASGPRRGDGQDVWSIALAVQATGSSADDGGEVIRHWRPRRLAARQALHGHEMFPVGKSLHAGVLVSSIDAHEPVVGAIVAAARQTVTPRGKQ